jgi:uncharacterized protein (DUF58 family)
MRRARTRGAGIEFHDYRPYQAGDDPRSIDWTVEARLRQLVVRVARAEGHLRLHVLLDTSASMGLGNPGKLASARRLAAALCYVAIEHRDAVGVVSFRNRVRGCLLPADGRVQLFRAFRALDELTAGGQSALEHSLAEYAALVRGPGLAVVISDFFEPGAGLRGLEQLLHRGLRPVALQILSPEEASPRMPDDCDLFDIEDENGSPLPVDAGLVAAYQERLAHHQLMLRNFCAAHGCPWVSLRSDMSMNEMLATLQAGRVLRALSTGTP